MWLKITIKWRAKNNISQFYNNLSACNFGSHIYPTRKIDPLENNPTRKIIVDDDFCYAGLNNKLKYNYLFWHCT